VHTAGGARYRARRPSRTAGQEPAVTADGGGYPVLAGDCSMRPSAPPAADQRGGGRAGPLAEYWSSGGEHLARRRQRRHGEPV